MSSCAQLKQLIRSENRQPDYKSVMCGFMRIERNQTGCAIRRDSTLFHGDKDFGGVDTGKIPATNRPRRKPQADDEAVRAVLVGLARCDQLVPDQGTQLLIAERGQGAGVHEVFRGLGDVERPGILHILGDQACDLR